MFVFAHAECSCKHIVGGCSGQGGGLGARRARAAALRSVWTEFTDSHFPSRPSEGATGLTVCMASPPAALSVTVPLYVSHDLKISIPHLILIIISYETLSLLSAIQFCTETLLSFILNNTTNDKKLK